MGREAASALGYGARRAANLRAVHQLPLVYIKRFAPMHRTPVIPQDNITDLPVMLPHLGGRIRPQGIEQCLGFFERHTVHICISPAAKIQRLAAGLRVLANDRMARPRRRARIIAGLCTQTDITRARVRSVMFDCALLNTFAQVLRQRVIGGLHVAKRCFTTRGRNLQRVQDARFWGHRQI